MNIWIRILVRILTLFLRSKRFPFRPVNYFIDISIHEDNIGRIDFVSNAAEFQVIADDVYDLGFQMIPYFGAIYLDSVIKLRNTSE